MYKIAIVGNIAAGKSTVQDYLVKKGFCVIDTDDIARNVRKKYVKRIVDALKYYDITDNNGNISKDKLSALAAIDEDFRMYLNNIMHPLIFDELDKKLTNTKYELVFVGIPLLFETGKEKDFDRIIFVYADDEIRLQRLINNREMDKKMAGAWINSQIPQNEKINKSNYIICNNGSKEELYRQIDPILDEITNFL